MRRRRDRADLSGKLVTSSGDGADQVTVRPEGSAQRRDLRLQIIFLNNPARPDTLDQRVLAHNGTARLDQGHQQVNRAPAKFHRPIVGKHLASLQQDPETAEVHGCRGIDDGIHGN